MLKWLRSPIVWGVLFIVAGILFLLEAVTGYQFGSLFWSVIFALGALLFITFYLGNRANWWALIPSIILAGLCLSTLFDVLLPESANFLSEIFVLGGIGASFLVVYLVDRRHWWAIIPAGVMFTLAVISVVEEIIGGEATGGLILIGIGITFAVLALLPAAKTRMSWAWIPAAVLIIIGTVIAGAAEQRLVYVVPVALIILGLFLIYRTFAART
jgi:hypothetical protein